MSRYLEVALSMRMKRKVATFSKRVFVDTTGKAKWFVSVDML